jgi:hypothetical protein
MSVQTVPLSDRLQTVAENLAATDLTTLSGVVDAEAFVDVLQHAAALAAEEETRARAANLYRYLDAAPVYPTLVELLGRAVGGVS